MMHAGRSKIIFSLIISLFFVNGCSITIAMERSQESIEQKTWPYYIETRPERREYFVFRPFKPSPHTFHMFGQFCPGHDSQYLYERCKESLVQLRDQAESARLHNDYRLLWQLMASASLLEAYQDATCLAMYPDASGLDQKFDLWKTIIKTFPKIDAKIREQYHCKEIFDDAMSRAAKDVQIGNEYSCSLLKCMLASKSKGEDLDPIRLPQFRSALEICACKDHELNAILQKFLYKNGTAQEKKRACEYFANKARQGDLESRCYCAHSKLSNSDFSGALASFESLVSSEQGRQMLPAFECLCDDRTLQVLGIGNKKKDKDAYAILGIIFNLRKDYLKAFPLLNACVEAKARCPYLYYIMACLFKDGYGRDVNFGNAMHWFVEAIDAGADGALLHDIENQLHDIEATGNIAAFCELLFLKTCDPGCGKEIRSAFNLCNEKSEAMRAQCFDYMQKKKFFDRLEKEARTGKPGALFMLSQIFYIKGLAAKEKAPAEFDRAFLTLEMVQNTAFDVHDMLGKTALDLSRYYLKIDNDKKALWSAQKAVDYKADGAAMNLLQVRMYSSLATEKSILEDAAILLKYAEDCDDNNLRGIAKTFVFKYKSKSGISFPRDLQRGYELVNKLLARVPDDVDGLYMLGRLLYEHGGSGNIPVNESLAQECLIKALEKKHEPQPYDFIHIACTYYKNAEYIKAFEWIEKASKLPRAKLYKGIFYLTVPVSCVDQKDRDEKGLTCFAESLYELNLGMQDPFVLYVLEHENFVSYIKNKAMQGDNRFLLVLLRFVCRYGLDMAGIDRETAVKFLDIVLQNNVLSADSFCSYLYRTGTWLEKSEKQAFALSKKVLESKNVPEYVVHEALDTLAELSKLDHNSFGIMASYELSRYFIDNPEHKKHALSQFSRAECQLQACIDDEDKEICEYARKTGLWDVMLDKARYDDDFAFCVGMSYAERLKLQPDIRWLNEIETKGMRYIEKTANASCISDAYVMLADALTVLGADKNRCAALLNKAFMVKPDNIVALTRLTELLLGPEGRCKIVHDNPHIRAILQALIEFEQGRVARTQKLKEQHFDVIKQNLLSVIDRVPVESGRFVDEQVNSEFNKCLKALEAAAGPQNQYLQDIFVIIRDRLKAKGFIQT